MDEKFDAGAAEEDRDEEEEEEDLVSADDAASFLDFSLAGDSRRCFSICDFHDFTSSFASSEMRAKECVRSFPTATPIFVACGSVS